jgi:hypothetical protein
LHYFDFLIGLHWHDSCDVSAEIAQLDRDNMLSDPRGSSQKAMNQCHPGRLRRLVLVKCRTIPVKPGKIPFSHFSSNHFLNAAKLASSVLQVLFE